MSGPVAYVVLVASSLLVPVGVLAWAVAEWAGQDDRSADGWSDVAARHAAHAGIYADRSAEAADRGDYRLAAAHAASAARWGRRAARAARRAAREAGR